MNILPLCVLLLLTGCVPYFPWDSSEDRFRAMKEINSHGCGYLNGNTSPPASHINGRVAGGWGLGMDADKLTSCLDKLRELP